MPLKKTKSIIYNLSQHGFPVKKDPNKKSWQSSMQSFANVNDNTYLGFYGSVCNLPNLETNINNQLNTEHNYHYIFDKNHEVVATIGFIESDDKQRLMAHGEFNATIKVSTSTFYVNGQFNKHFITHINCKNNDTFNKEVQCLRNKPGNYAVHKFLKEIFIKDIEKNNNKTNKWDKPEEKIQGISLPTLVKIGLMLLIMYQFKLCLNNYDLLDHTNYQKLIQ